MAGIDDDGEVVGDEFASTEMGEADVDVLRDKSMGWSSKLGRSKLVLVQVVRARRVLNSGATRGEHGASGRGPESELNRLLGDDDLL